MAGAHAILGIIGVIASPLHPVILSGLRYDAFADAVDTLAGAIAEELWRRRSISDLLIIGDRLRDEFDVHGSMVGGDTAPDGYADLMATERLLGWVFGPEGAGEAFSDAWTRSLWLVILEPAFDQTAGIWHGGASKGTGRSPGTKLSGRYVVGAEISDE